MKNGQVSILPMVWVIIGHINQFGTKIKRAKDLNVGIVIAMLICLVTANNI